MKVAEIDPICAMQACMDGYEVVSAYRGGVVESGADEELLASTDLLVTATGNYHVCDSQVLGALKSGAVVCNIGHFDNEIDTAWMRERWEWEEVKPQVHKVYRDRASNDHLILLSEGRLVNLGNATGHPSRVMDGSFTNQVLAQIYLFERRFADLEPDMKPAALAVEVLPKRLDEEVAAHMVRGFGGVLTRLTEEQAKYINVSAEAPVQARRLQVLRGSHGAPRSQL